MKLPALALGTAVLAAIVPATDGHAQGINFSKIDKFEILVEWHPSRRRACKNHRRRR